MINNWDIISRIDHNTGEIHYTLYMDGTEHDARLMAKKLKGYVKEAQPAQAPYVYAFELPKDIDEGTQDKIRAAAQEGVNLTNKINQFVPGGVLGDPLFNSNTGTEDKAFPTFLTLDPSASFFAGSPDQAPKQRPQLDLTALTAQNLGATGPIHKQRVSLTDNLEEATSAQIPPEAPQFSTTVREVFQTQPSMSTFEEPAAPATAPLPPNNTPSPETALSDTNQPQEKTISIPPAPVISKPEENIDCSSESAVPEQPAEQPKPTPLPQVLQEPAADINPISISDSDMLIKDMEGSMLEKMPLEDILSAETKYDMFVDVNKDALQTEQAQAQKVKKMSEASPQEQDTFNVFEHELKEQTNVIDVEDVQAITDRLAEKNMDFTKQPHQPEGPQQTPSAPKPETDAFVAEQKTILPPTVPAADAKAAAASVPFTLGSAKDEKKHLLSDLSSETLPEEENLEATLPPSHIAGEDDSLPEITVRTQKETLEKTFNLETTFNTELIKRQHEKNMALQEGRPVPQDAQEPPHTKTILRLRKPTGPQAPNAQAGKTFLRLRRKESPTDGVAPTLKSTMSPERAAENMRMAKQKAIDHSIQIPTSELKKHNWPWEVPLVPTYTLNNMVMSVNRFAHATAISVIESPGKLYNPLVLHGGTGTGKTHFLNALAYAFSQKFGQEHIFMTNGVRLSRGIQRYVMEGNIDKFENFMESVQALLIDDIHLLAINEQNRAFISSLLNTFIQSQKQIVITSKYPPESLEKLEELINFKLDSGWISELKPATGATHFRIVKKMLLENGVDLNDKQIEEFFGGSHMTLGTVTRSIRRLKVLENLIFPNISVEEKSQAGIFEKLLATKGEDKTSELINKDPMEITSLNTVGNGEWGRIGFFYPQNCSDMMNWMVYALQQRAKELGVEGGFDIVVRSSYATENIISSAFKIANLCDNKKLKGAVILGPKPDSCDPSVRENFYDILTHMLEIMLIRCGIINYENVRLPSTYVKVISELMR